MNNVNIYSFLDGHYNFYYIICKDTSINKRFTISKHVPSNTISGVHKTNLNNSIIEFSECKRKITINDLCDNITDCRTFLFSTNDNRVLNEIFKILEIDE